jgi:hypothetical protein
VRAAVQRRLESAVARPKRRRVARIYRPPIGEHWRCGSGQCAVCQTHRRAWVASIRQYIDEHLDWPSATALWTAIHFRP